jgi:hypothetical protein
VRPGAHHGGTGKVTDRILCLMGGGGTRGSGTEAMLRERVGTLNSHRNATKTEIWAGAQGYEALVKNPVTRLHLGFQGPARSRSQHRWL